MSLGAIDTKALNIEFADDNSKQVLDAFLRELEAQA